jgi:uncharacterized protein YggT (Ycf19 family)
MKFGMWDTLLNLFLMLFWLAIWHRDDRALSLNHMLAPLARIQKSMIDFLQPVLPFLPRPVIALLAFIFLLVFRGLAVPHNVNWAISLGFAATWTDGTSLRGCLFMSVMSFAVFLFKLWCVSLIYVSTRRGASVRDSSDALYQVSHPFVDVPIPLRPFALLGFGILLAWLFAAIGVAPQGAAAPAFSWSPAAAARLLVISLSGWVAVLPVLQSLLVLVIIGSFVSLFTGSHALAAYCGEWIDLLIGPLRRYPLRIGMLDLTPLVFVFLLRVVYLVLIAALARSFQMLS